MNNDDHYIKVNASLNLLKSVKDQFVHSVYLYIKFHENKKILKYKFNTNL